MTKQVPMIGFRITQARMMRGLSLRDLATLTGSAVSHNAIARYERGEMMPGSVALSSLAVALEQPIDYFFRPPRVRLSGAPRFRAKDGLDDRQKAAILSSASDYLDRYAEVEELLGATIPFINPLADQPEVTTPEEAARQAAILRSAWNLGCDPLPNIKEMMELHGVKVFEAPVEKDHFDGLCVSTDRGPLVVVASWLNKNLLRKRMTEIHELAHAVMNIPKHTKPEVEEKLAWSFAGEMMLPEKAFRDAFGGGRTVLSMGELIDLKMLFGASIMAMVFRASSLGLVDKELSRAFWRHVKAEKWREKGEEPGDNAYQGNETYSRFQKLVSKAVLEGSISHSKGASLLGMSNDELRGMIGDTISE